MHGSGIGGTRRGPDDKCIPHFGGGYPVSPSCSDILHMQLRFREQDAEVEHRLEQRGAVPAFELISTGCTSGMATISSGPYTFATTLLSPASSSSSVPSGSGMGRLGASCSEGVQMSLEPVEMTGLEGAPLHNPSLLALQGHAVCVPCGEGHMAQTEEQPSPLLTPVQTPRWGTLVHWGDTWGCGHGVIWGGGYTCDGRQHGGRRWATERVRGVCREQGACRVQQGCSERDRVLSGSFASGLARAPRLPTVRRHVRTSSALRCRPNSPPSTCSGTTCPHSSSTTSNMFVWSTFTDRYALPLPLLLFLSPPVRQTWFS